MDLETNQPDQTLSSSPKLTKYAFMLLILMLVTSLSMSNIPFFIPQLEDIFIEHSIFIYWTSFFLLMGAYFCYTSIEIIQTTVLKYFILLIFGICMTAIFTQLIFDSGDTVKNFSSIIIPLVISFWIILGSYQTKLNLTRLSKFVFPASIIYTILCIIPIISKFYFEFKWMCFIYASIATILFSINLSIDVQIIKGDKNYGYEYTDYNFASIQLMMNVINLTCSLSTVINELFSTLFSEYQDF